MSDTRLVVIRHGATVGEGFMGQNDRTLSPEGVAQMGALAERLARGTCDVLYTSDLGRAVHSAGIVAKEMGLQAVADERLRERHIGVLEGLSLEEARTEHADVMRGHDELGEKYVMPEGESGLDHMKRVVAFLDSVRQDHNGQTVVAVSHAGAIKCILRHILGFPYHTVGRVQCDHASLCTLRLEQDEWMLEVWNDTAHLEDATT
ncbi:MAG: histidine phosphatase family protein [bacterium]|nr:histidine phosphatase family protein [bacterium]